MTSKTFVDFLPPVIDAAWLNDVNNTVYSAVGDGTHAPTTPAQVVTNLGLAGLAGFPANIANTTNMSEGVALVGGAARVVGSVATLRTLPKTGAVQALVTGYYSQGDGGGGMYWYDSVDTTSADNGGTIIVASDGGRWKLIQNQLVSVRQFGATGNGSVDDTTAIQSALNWAAGYAEGVTIRFPSGRYLISTTLHVTGSYTRLVGDSMNGALNLPQNIGVLIYTATNNIGDMILVNNGATGIYAVMIEELSFGAASGLAAPPNGIHLKDASECVLERITGAENLNAAVKLNGVDIIEINRLSSSAGNAIGVYITLNGTSLFVNNTTVWMSHLNLYRCSTSGVLFDGPTSDVVIRDSYIEATPASILVEAQSLQTNTLYDLTLDGVTSWNSAGNPYTNTTFITMQAPSGSANYLRVQNVTMKDCYSFQNNSSSYHVVINQNSNSNGNTAFFGIGIERGSWFGATGSLVSSNATSCTGDIRGNVNALTGYQSGTALPLRSGTGTVGWATEESGTWTPADASGAGLSFANVYGTWVRKGTLVTATYRVVYPSTASGTNAALGGLPFNTQSTPANNYGGTINYTTASMNPLYQLLSTGSSTISFFTASGAAVTNTNLTNADVRGTLVYQSQ